jgi:uncharacterized protein (DUF2132 family)
MTLKAQKSPLEGKTLKVLLEELVTHYGWPFLGHEISINCFNVDPSINSSLKFLRRTPWARTKVEALYLRHVAGELNSPDQ